MSPKSYKTAPFVHVTKIIEDLPPVESGAPVSVVNHWNPTWLPRSLHSLVGIFCIWVMFPVIRCSFGQFSYLKVWFHTLLCVSLGFFRPHSPLCLLINSVSCVFFLDFFTFWRSTVTVLHPCTKWVPTTVFTEEDVLLSVDTYPELTKTVDESTMTVRPHQDTVFPSHLIRVYDHRWRRGLCLLRDHEEHGLGHTQEV